MSVPWKLSINIYRARDPRWPVRSGEYRLWNLQAPTHPIDCPLVERGAHWLRGKLQLTLFGFDVVVDQNTGESVGCPVDTCDYFLCIRQSNDVMGNPFGQQETT